SPAHRRRTMILGQMSGVPHSEGARGCRYCRPNLEGIAMAHNLTRDPSLIGLASQIRCGCRALWLKDLASSMSTPIAERMDGYLERLERAADSGGFSSLGAQH